MEDFCAASSPDMPGIESSSVSSSALASTAIERTAAAAASSSMPPESVLGGPNTARRLSVTKIRCDKAVLAWGWKTRHHIGPYPWLPNAQHAQMPCAV